MSSVCSAVQTIKSGDGSKTQFSFDFPYVFKTEIHVYFWNVTTKEYDEVLTTDSTYPWQVPSANPTIVEFTGTAPPAPGDATANIKIRRITNIDDIQALFNPGSAIRSDDLNSNFEQLRFAVQESLCPDITEAEVTTYLQNYYWNNFDETVASTDTWVSSDTKIATTAAMDARFQDEAAETITSTETWANDDNTIATTAAIDDQIDNAITNDILINSTGLTKTTSGGQTTLGIGAGSVDLDRIKDADIITSSETNPNNDTTIATTAKIDDMIDDAVTNDILIENNGLTKTSSGGQTTLGIGVGAVDLDRIKASDIIVSGEANPNNNTTIASTAKIDDMIDEAITGDVLVNGTGLTKATSGGQTTLGIGANSVDLDRIKSDDIVATSAYSSTWTNEDDKVVTAGALAARHDVSVGTSLPTTDQAGKLFLDITVGNQSLKAYDGNGWRTVAVGQPYTPTTTTVVRYVDVTNGSDASDVTGFLPQAPLRSIGRALTLINASSSGDGSLIKVAPGVYQETLPLRIKKNNISIVGESMRSCFVHPTVATENNDMFEVDSGTYIANLTLLGLKVPTSDQGSRNNSLDNDATYGLPSNQPFSVRFRTDVQPTILKSPYIQNCTHFSDAHFDNANFDPNTFPSTDSQTYSAVAGDETSAPCGGGLLVDGSAVSSSSPIRSMVVDAFTQITLDGPGILVTNNGYAQLVSFFGTFAHYHAKAKNGGQINLSNCVSDFGRYGLISDGKSPSAIATATASAANSGATTITIGAITTAGSFHGTVSRPLNHMMVTIDGVDYGVVSSTANGSGWDIVLTSGLTSNITNTTVSFALRSYISTGGHTFEFVGVGTDYGDHPDNGGVPIEANQVIELNGGKVWQSSTDHVGKFKAGGVLVVDQVSETVNLKATTVTGNLAVTGTVDGRDVAADGTKLDGIESGATADQTASEIRTLVESASDSNVFTDADHTKLNGIEALADVTDATNVDAAGAVMNSDTSTTAMQFVVDEDNMSSNSSTKVPTQQSVKAYVDAEVAGVVDSAPGTLDTLNELAAALGDDANFSTTVTNSIATKLPLAGGTMTGNIVMSGSQTVDGRDLSVDGAKLDGIESGATGDQTAAEIRTLVESASDSNVFTDADHSKLNAIEANATADQTASEIRSLVESATDSNVFTDADHTKLNGIESGATGDQTNAEIRAAVEAATDSNVFTDADHTKLNGIASGAIANVVEDTTPQLGGDLDMNSNFISSGIVGIKNQGSQSEVRLYCEASNAHYASIKAPPHSGFSGNVTFTMPGTAGSNGQVLSTNGSGTLSWVSQPTAYSNSDVDAHLNQSNPTSGYVLSWNGSDYAWVAQSSGGGGGISNVVEDTTPQLGGNLDMQSNNISGTGTIIANSTASSTAGMRKITTSTSAPSGGSDGDIWIKYTA